MTRYRVNILNSSIITDLRLFDVTGANSCDAAKEAAVRLFGTTFSKEDFEISQVLRFNFFHTNKFEVQHKRIEAFNSRFQISSL